MTLGARPRKRLALSALLLGACAALCLADASRGWLNAGWTADTWRGLALGVFFGGLGFARWRSGGIAPDR